MKTKSILIGCLSLIFTATFVKIYAMNEKTSLIYTDNFATSKWKTWHANMETNDAMKPDFSLSSSVAYEPGGKSLVIRGNGNSQAIGSYDKDLKAEGVKFTADHYYRFTAYYAVKNIKNINDKVFACLTWGGVYGTEKLLPAAIEENNGISWIKAQRILRLEDKQKVILKLSAGWLPIGSTVYFGKVVVEHLPDYAPQVRTVKVGTIDGAPPKKSTLQENGDYFVKEIRSLCTANDSTLDAICLPEYFNTHNVSRKKFFDVAVDLENSAYMQGFKDVARECKVNIVGSVLEKDNGVLYNTGFVLDRNGRIAGTQRKSHVANFEVWLGGAGRGDDLHLIETDFGKIGILICWDYYLSDPIRTLASKGADIIFIPISGDSRAADGQKRKAPEYIGVASALQNNIPMVFCFEHVNIERGNQSLIIDQNGVVKARSSKTISDNVKRCNPEEPIPQRPMSFLPGVSPEKMFLTN